MAYLRKLGSHFDPVFIKPANLSRAVTLFRVHAAQIPDPEGQLLKRRQLDRRCGIDRRSQQQPILLDTRSPYSRRKINHRRTRDDNESAAGIDVYA